MLDTLKLLQIYRQIIEVTYFVRLHAILLFYFFSLMHYLLTFRKQTKIISASSFDQLLQTINIFHATCTFVVSEIVLFR